MEFDLCCGGRLLPAQFHRSGIELRVHLRSRVSRCRKSFVASQARELGYNHNFSFFVHPSSLSVFPLPLRFIHFCSFYLIPPVFSLQLWSLPFSPLHFRPSRGFFPLWTIFLFSLLSHLCVEQRRRDRRIKERNS